MIVDCHIHIAALSPEHGFTSPRLLNSIPFRFVRWHLGIHGADEKSERALEMSLADLLDQTPELDAGVILAFDAVHDEHGNPDWNRTHLYVKNDYPIELSRRHPKMLFGASIHPYRKDAVAEVERCASAGAVLVKWLPLTQCFNPADPKCFPFYEALAHHRIPLLCHTGGEQTLPVLDSSVPDPLLLEPALQRGVTVIAAHCGTRSMPWQIDYLPHFARLCRDYPNLYGDTSALNLPTRSYAYQQLLDDELLRSRLIHGSDWPILPLPPAALLNGSDVQDLMQEPNWLRRDVLIKRKLPFDEAFWHRGGQVLRIGH